MRWWPSSRYKVQSSFFGPGDRSGQSTLSRMGFICLPEQKWWMFFTVSATLPVWSIYGLLNFGGWFADEMPYHQFQFFAFFCFIVALVSTMFCLRRLIHHKITRVIAVVVLCVIFLSGALVSIIGSTCGPTTMKLGRAFGSESREFASRGGCDMAMQTNRRQFWL